MSVLQHNGVDRCLICEKNTGGRRLASAEGARIDVPQAQSNK